MKRYIDPAKLRAARKAARLNQTDLAEKIGRGWTKYTVSNLERGRDTEVTADEVDALATVLGLTPSALERQEAPPVATPAGLDLDPARLRAARKAAGLTQHELAARSGFSQSSLSGLETGSTGISLEGVQTLAKALNVSVKYLLGGWEATWGREQNPVEAIRTDAQMPAGLRDLATSPRLVEELQIEPEEWGALATLATGWRDADLTPRDGWVQILVSLRTASLRRTVNPPSKR